MAKVQPIVFGYFNDKPLAKELQDTVLAKSDYSQNILGKYNEYFTDKYTLATVCLGDSKTYSIGTLKGIVGQVLELFPTTSIVITDTFMLKSRDLKAVVETFILAAAQYNYTFDKYKTTNTPKEQKKINFFGTNRDKVTEYVTAAMILSQNINLAKDLGNEPPNKLTPTVFAQQIIDFAEAETLSYLRFKGKEALEDIHAKALLAVNQGSRGDAELVGVEYIGNPLSKKTIGLVGKGITFDTGGYSLKQVTTIVNMKSDMCGAATLFAAFKTIVEYKLPINIVLVIATTDNVISRDAYLPDDVIETMNGKTVQIVSTDAEGRLVLADALTFIQREYNVNEIIDAATLTGAAVAALGAQFTAGFSNNDEIYRQFEDVTAITDEHMWRMPLHPVYTKGVRSAYTADITNKPSANGGHASYAAAFLQEFIENDTPWLHLDIAAVASYTSPQFGYGQGATGIMVNTVVKYLENKANLI